MGDLFDAYVIGNYNQRLTSWRDGDGGGGIPPGLFLVVVLLAAVVWGLVKLVIALRNFTRANTGSLLLAFAAIALVVAGLAWLFSGRNQVAAEEWTGAVTTAVVGAVVLVAFKAAALGFGAGYEEQFSGLLALVLGLGVVVLFVLAVAALLFGTWYALDVTRSTPAALGVGTPATWGTLTWAWFLLFGHPDFLPWGNPLPGLNAMDVAFLVPFVALGVAGTAGHLLPTTGKPEAELDWATTGDDGPDDPTEPPEDLQREARASELRDRAESDPASVADDVPELASLLGAASPTTRKRAATALEHLAATDSGAVTDATDDLVERLDDPEPAVVLAAVGALGHVAEQRPSAVAAAAPAVARLLDHDRPSVRTAAVGIAATIAPDSPGPFADATDRLASLLAVSDLQANRDAASVLRAVAEHRPSAIEPVRDRLREALDEGLAHREMERDLENALQQVGEPHPGDG